MTLLVRGYKGLWLTVAFAAAVMFLPARADAALVLTLDWTSGGGGTLQCVDNDLSCDSNIAPNLINYDSFAQGDTTGNWIVDIQTGSSTHGTVAQLHLSSTLRATAADTLTMTLADFFTGPLGAGTLRIYSGGAGTVGLDGNFTGHAAKTSTALGLFVSTPECQYPLGEGPLGLCDVSAAHPILSSGYTMLLIQTASVTGGTDGNWSTNTNVTNTGPTVPEPATLSLFGLGLFGVAQAVRRRRAQARSK